MTWIYDGKLVSCLDSLPKEAYGFIYLIINKTNNKKYIGRKNLYSERTVSLNKKEIAALENKRLKKWKTVIKQSNWLDYTGSCKELNEDIALGNTIEKQILVVCFSKREMSYQETKQLFVNEVLEKEEYYNNNIESRYFRGNIS